MYILESILSDGATVPLLAGGCAIDKGSYNGAFNFDMLPEINDYHSTIGSAYNLSIDISYVWRY